MPLKDGSDWKKDPQNGKWMTSKHENLSVKKIGTTHRERLKEKWEKRLLRKQKKLTYRVPFPRYHSYAGMCDELEFLAMDYSDIAQVYSIGRSVEGRQILGIKITADVGAQRPQLRPQVKFSANIHGDEVVSREMVIALARALCEQYEFDEKITKLLNKCEIHL